MKTTKRIPKSIAIVLILGLGIVNNLEKKHVITQTYHQLSAKLEYAKESNTVEISENKLFTYTITFIKILFNN